MPTCKIIRYMNPEALKKNSAAVEDVVARIRRESDDAMAKLPPKPPTVPIEAMSWPGLPSAYSQLRFVKWQKTVNMDGEGVWAAVFSYRDDFFHGMSRVSMFAPNVAQGYWDYVGETLLDRTSW